MIDTLCDGLDGGNMVVVACVYCDFRAHEGQSASGVLAAFLKQLVAGVEPIPEAIKVAFDRAKSEVDGRRSDSGKYARCSSSLSHCCYGGLSALMLQMSFLRNIDLNFGTPCSALSGSAQIFGCSLLGGNTFDRR